MLKNIPFPSIKISEHDSCKLISKSECLMMNDDDCVSCVKDNIFKTLNKYVYEPMDEFTKYAIADDVHGSMSQMEAIGALSNPHVSVMTNDELAKSFTCPYDSLVHECDSYSEYKMKKAIVSGDVSKITEKEFIRQRQFDPDEDNVFHIDVIFDIPQLPRSIELNFKMQ